MLPEEVWKDGRRVKLPPLQGGANNFDYLTYRACYEITACLEKWIGVRLDFDGQHTPALLMMNHYQGPVWMHVGQGQEVGAVRDVIRATRKALQVLKNGARLEAVGDNCEAQKELERALRQVDHLPSPIPIWLDSLGDKSISGYLEFLHDIKALYSEYLKARDSQGGHQRARVVAVVLRAIFETYTDLPIKAGVTEGVPDGIFAKCLQEVFSWAGIPVDFYRYAREAKQLPANDEQLTQYKWILASLPQIGSQNET